jgi:oxygen-independent coproporphyrinogen III oxidase
LQYPGLYIHTPFCRSKCPYCGFYSIASTSLLTRWLEALKKEIALYRGIFNEPFNSLYLGGGTPTLLTADQLKEITDYLFACYQFNDDTEITIEANPGDMDISRITGLKTLGFNRVNLGVQSFNDDELLFLGRRHNANQAEEAISSLRDSGFDNIGIDLIYGIQGQSLDAWKNNLDKALAFQPEHVSCYQLTIETCTPFSAMKEKGTIKPLNERMEEIFFLATSEFLEDHGYIHYEISNFAKDETFCSRHNRKYWDHTPYLGLGPSSHSFNGASRWWNQRSVRGYCEALEKGLRPVEECEDLTEEQMMMEAVSLGLRTIWGFDLKLLPNDPDLNNIISMLHESGYIHVRDEKIIATKKGFLLADHLPLYFFTQ